MVNHSAEHGNNGNNKKGTDTYDFDGKYVPVIPENPRPENSDTPDNLIPQNPTTSSGKTDNETIGSTDSTTTTSDNSSRGNSTGSRSNSIGASSTGSSVIIADATVPLASAMENITLTAPEGTWAEGLETIAEEEVPLAAMPKTGESSNLAAMIGVMMGGLLLGLDGALKRRKMNKVTK